MKYIILSLLVGIMSTSCQSTKPEVVHRSATHERNFQIWLRNNDPSATNLTKKKDDLICPQSLGHMMENFGVD